MSRSRSHPGAQLDPGHFHSGLAGHFAGFINRLATKPGPELELAAALVSIRTAAGHICLDLAAAAGRPLSPSITGADDQQSPATIRCPELSSWREQLLHSGVVGRPGEQTPLILSPQDRLYLHRFWEYEKTVADWILARSRDRLPVDLDKLARDLARLFPESSSPAGIDWRKIAAIVAVTCPFAVVTGGPGTGKTSTVARILALICQQSLPSLPKILLAAPTGKAAARLQEAITRARAAMGNDPEIIAAIPDRAMTIHRLLASRHGIYRSKGDTLSADLVVVDEASMVDLPLMARLVRALPAKGRLILLGDRDQLSSVEPGSILGDICHPAALGSFSTGFRDLVTALTSNRLPENRQDQVVGPLADTMVELRKSFRFREKSGIRRVSSAVRHNDADGLIKALQQHDLADISWQPVPDASEMGRELGRRLDRQGLDFLRCDSPEEAFAALGRFRILCALRHGPYGVLAINALVEKHLARAGLIPRPDDSGNSSPAGPHYCGQPLMITRNDYRTGLFNGDTGILLPDPGNRDRLRAFFQNPDGTIRTLSPGHLPSHETVHAITVHKSQGSEFDRILLILPPAMSPVLTRELLYTALTRAKNAIELWATEEVLRATIASPITRDSGLMDALWEDRGQETGNR
ncbi:MAG: exodeoxyribonuclease V subunit alpha [Desulfobacterales bacterium]|nr:exodeoxyribonuclease V subunit alpha [Desulfobacterales bacterium]